MYRNIDECLTDVYRFGTLRIEPMGNTGLVMRWCENKGVMGSRSDLTQAEWHANAAMIQKRIDRVLNRFERAVIAAKYGKDFSGISDIVFAIYARGAIDDMGLCADLLQHIYSGCPKVEKVLDKYDLSRRTFYRRRKSVLQIVIEWENVARMKLDDEFRGCGIITI